MSGSTLGETLPEYVVRARNLFADSRNRIHDDEVARRHGFAGALVAGTTVYGYLTHPLVAAWGPAWLERGTVAVRIVRPVYDGDLVRVRGRVVARSGSTVAGETTAEVEVVTPRDEVAARAVAGLAWGAPAVVPDSWDYPAGPLPATRPPATPEALGALDRLGTPALVLDAEGIHRAARELDDALAAYDGPAAIAHPGLLLQQANRALAENVALGPWIHVASDVAHGSVARAGETLTTRGRVTRLYEQKGRSYVELDLLIVAGEARAVAHVRHTAIYRLPEP